MTWLQLSSTGGRDRPALVFDSAGFLHEVSGRVTTGVYYFNPTACPSDSLISTLSFNSISTWITAVPGLASAKVPSGGLGLRTVIPGGSSSGPACTTNFCLVGTNTNTSFNGRFGAGLVTLNYPITYQTWSYVINAAFPSASVQSTNPPGLFNAAGTQQFNYVTSTVAPAGSLYLFGGQCGHQANPASPMGDPDVWTSPDGGYTWKQLSGASGMSGSYQIYVNALSANTPYWQGSNPATYPSVNVPQTYGTYPGSVPIHDNVHQRFHLLGGDYYYGSGVWRPTATEQSSGGAYSLNSTGKVPLNLEGLGWTNLCLDPVGGLTYSYCDSFTARTSAAGTTDSKGNLYILNGISQYDSNSFPYVLLGDVWMSSNGGLVWTQSAASTPWSSLGNGRMESAAASYYSSYYSNDVIYSIGGCSTSSAGFNVAGSTLIENPYNDVYVSINQGQNWYTVTTAAAFSPRCGLSVAVTSGGVLVVVGGRSAQSYTSSQSGWPTYYNSILGAQTLTDVWTSMDGGATFYQLTTTGGRDRAAIAFDNSGFLHVVSGKTGLGEGYLPSACPNDAYVSSQSFNNVTAWIKTVVPSATVPTTTGLLVAAVTNTVPTAKNPFFLTALNGGAGFNGRAAAGLVSLPNSVVYQNWSYVINSSYPTANVASTLPAGLFIPGTNTTTSNRPLSATTPANSLFLFGGECGHGVNPSASVGDPDVWTSPDSGSTWYLVGGAHGLDFDSNTGTYGQYVSALSANTPFWQGSNPATYPAVNAPQSYATYPGAIPLHDSVNHKFYLLGGETYAGSGHWNPTAISQSSGAPSTSLQQLSTVSGAPINPEAIGWTNACLNSTSGSYQSCTSGGTFPARSSAGGCVDSKGNLYVMNGISSYDWTNVFPQVLLADVWTSTNAGLSWTQPTLSVPWGGVQGRMESASVSYFSSYYNADVLYNIGGCTVSSTSYGITGATQLEYGFNDVYASINGGATWYNISNAATWPARCGTTAAVTSNGVLALVGGRKPQSYLTTGFPTYYEAVLGYYTLTDIWTSLDGGYTWLQLSATGGRDRPALLMDGSGYLHVVSGRVTSGVYYFTSNACPSDSLISSVSFNAITSWITTVPGNTGYTPPSTVGLIKGPPASSTGSPRPSTPSSTGGGGGGGGGGTTGSGSTTAAPPSTSSSSSSSLSGGAIAGIVIGSVVGAVILCALLAFFCVGRGGTKKDSTSGPGFQEHHGEESNVRGDTHGDHEEETGGVEMTNA